MNAGDKLLNQLAESIQRFFGPADKVVYTVTLYRRKDGRIYLKGLKQKGFTIRDFLVENSSALSFSMAEDIFDLRVLSSVCEE